MTTTAIAPGAAESVTRHPHLPQVAQADEAPWPAAPEQIEQTGVDPQELRALLLRLAYMVPSFSTESAAKQVCLPMNIVEELCWQLKQDHLLEIQGQKGPFNYTYAATQRGREHAERLMEVCGYVGPAPVSLAAYSALLERQNAGRQPIVLADVQRALADLVLPPEIVEVAALAAASRRSLFLFGPAGNGKTSLGKLLHHVQSGELWIPHAVSVGSSVIRLYDPQVHQQCDGEPPEEKFDRRWIRVRRPFVIAGGEMTIEELDLGYSPSLRFYEAPPHVKANGGTFLIDDFGRQRVDPHELLNRWIVPLESQIDHLSLHTGQKIQIPFQLMLIVATNLAVSDVADPAFLRRMGYRIHLDSPMPEDFSRIFVEYARRHGVAVENGLLRDILDRYRTENRPLRASEPRDLIDRVRDIRRLRGEPLELDREVIDVAWRGYFGATAN